jgi:hypothetical protein
MKHILLALGLATLVIACGDDGKQMQNPTPECSALGIACTAGTECCSGNCDTTVGQCAPPLPGQCLAADAECQSGAECCTFACVNFRCSGDQCTSDGESCDNDGQCCGGVCGSDGKCTPLNVACDTSGNACTADAECCSGFCKDNICNGAPSYCTQINDVCSVDSECCSGVCSKTDGATYGLCINTPGGGGTTECKPSGEVCADPAEYTGGDLPVCGGECCSRACRPYGPTSVMICQPPSGCRPTGETCTQDSDCCGDGADSQNVKCEIEPGFTIGRCDNGQGCRANGQVCKLSTTSCNAENNCCSNECHQDALGIPRCGGMDNCTPPAAGTVCASSADCCGNPCTPDGSGQYVCSGSCIATGGTCTTSTDCCAGTTCTVPPGSTMGTCGMDQGCVGYGQACTAGQTTCCDGLTCGDWDGDANTGTTCGTNIIIL